MEFKLKNTDGYARRGQLKFARGTIEAPVFMPVGTYGAVKPLTPEDLTGIDAQIILVPTVLGGNAYGIFFRHSVCIPTQEHGNEEIHNLYYYLQLMQGMRDAIEKSEFDDFVQQFYRLRSKVTPNI